MIKLNGISKAIAIIAIIRTVLKILSSNENNLGSPIRFLPINCFLRADKLTRGIIVNKLNDINPKQKRIRKTKAKQ